MRKALSVIFALILVSSAAMFTSCSTDDDNNNSASEQNEVEKDSETEVETEPEAEAETEPDAEAETEPDAEAETEPDAEAEVEAETEPETEETEASTTETGYVFEEMSTWHYKTFVCPYTDGSGVVGGSAANGYFEETDDEMAEFLNENPEWYKDTTMMSEWEEADAPFGDRISTIIAAQTDFILDPDNTNGLMVYKTFNIDSLENTTFEMNSFYDNTVYIYVNGELFYTDDANCGSGDWYDDMGVVECNTEEGKTLNDFLVEGENYIAVSLKNCWGGREFEMYISYVKDLK